MSSGTLKKLAVLTVLLVATWAYYLYRQVPRSTEPFAAGSDKTDEITLAGDGQTVHLKKNDSQWQVSVDSGPFYPADSSKVSSLLTALKGVQVEDEIASDKSHDSEFELKPVVRMLDGKGNVLAEGEFGKQAQDFNHIYFRPAGKPGVYLARGLLRGELGTLTLNGWRSRDLVNMPETKITEIHIQGADFKTILVRQGTETWTSDGKTVDPAPVNALVGTLAHLRADDFVDPAAYPAITDRSLTYAAIEVKGPEATVTLRFGTEDPKTKRYPVSTGPDSGMAWISEYTAKSLLQKPSAFPPHK